MYNPEEKRTPACSWHTLPCWHVLQNADESEQHWAACLGASHPKLISLQVSGPIREVRELAAPFAVAKGDSEEALQV